MEAVPANSKVYRYSIMIRILGILLFALLTPILSDGQTYSVPTAKAQRQMNQLRGLISNMEYAQAGLLAQKITQRYQRFIRIMKIK